MIVTPRYAAYCRENRADTPEAMMARDIERWPGGRMCGFILWMREMWSAWRSETSKVGARLTAEDHAAFDDWLNRRTAC